MTLLRISRTIGILAVAVSLSLAAPLGAMAQTPQSKPVAMSMTDTMAKVSVASDLVAYGRANKDAYALLTAAKMLSSVGAPVQDPKSTPEAGGEPAKYDPSAILDEAKSLAGDNAGLKTEIEKAATGIPPKPASGYWAYVCNCCGCWWVLVY